MKTQISRDSYRPAQRYSGVYQQQGRMITDADWNELVDILKGRLVESVASLSGKGAPRVGGAVRIDANGGGEPVPSLTWGRLHLDGAVADLMPGPGADPAAFDYSRQADLPSPPPLPDGQPYTLYADVWERPVTALEDPSLLDPALHGADTCTRTRTMAQVKWCPADVDPETDPARNPTRGDLPLRLSVRAAVVAADPCDPCADSVSLEQNPGVYLFRVEVHDLVADAAGGAIRLVLKWSSENGAEQGAPGDLPPDFGEGPWVYEWFDEDSERYPGVHLAPGFEPSRGQLIEVLTQPELQPNRWVRRWDGYCVLERSAAVDNWSLVEGRDQGTALTAAGDAQAHGHVRLDSESLAINLQQLALTLGGTEQPLGSGTLVVGDYWLAAVRGQQPGEAVLGDGEQGQPPQGIRHRYLVLGRVDAGGALLPLSDAERRRLSFPPLTDLRAADVALEEPRPAILAEAENLQQAISILGDIDIDALDSSAITHLLPACPEPSPAGLLGLTAGQHPVAVLLDALLCELRADGLPLDKSQPLCGLLADPAVETVQDALQTLCEERPSTGLGLPVGEGGYYETLAEALADSVPGDDLSLCLLPGVHPLSAPLGPVMRHSIRIVGGGTHASTLRLDGLLSLEAAGIVLEDLAVELPSAEDALRLAASEVNVRGCRFQRLPRPEPFAWVRTFGGSGPGEEEARALAVDNEGNLYVAGTYYADSIVFKNPDETEGQVFFGPGPKAFVCKLDPEGRLLWARAFPGDGDQEGRGVAVDPNGDLLVAGVYRNNVDIGGGPLEVFDSRSIFIAKLDGQDGAHIWSWGFGGDEKCEANDLATDTEGNVLLAGSIDGTFGFQGTMLAIGIGSRSLLVMKLDGEGTHQWSQVFGGDGFDRAQGVAVDNAGHVLVTGAFQQSVNFGGVPLEAVGTATGFVLKLASGDGATVWAKPFGGERSCEGKAVAVDADGGVLVTGSFYVQARFGDVELSGSGLGVGFVWMLDADGNPLWARAFDGEDVDGGKSVSIDGDGRILVTGHVSGRAELGGGVLGAGNDSTDCFVLALDLAGRHLWSRVLGGTAGGLGVAVTVEGNPIICGRFEGSLDFGAGEVTSAPGGRDILIFRLRDSDTPRPLVSIAPRAGEDTCTLHWLDNRCLNPGATGSDRELARSEAEVALALADQRVGGSIRASSFEGTLDLFHDLLRRHDPGTLPATVPPLAVGEPLVLAANRLLGVTVRRDLDAEETAAYRSLAVVDNTFEKPGSTFVARELELSGNSFAGSEIGRLAAGVIGESAVVVGNRSTREMFVQGPLERVAVAGNLLVALVPQQT